MHIWHEISFGEKEAIQTYKTSSLLLATRLLEGNLLSSADGSGGNTSDAHLSLEIIVINVTDEGLQVVIFR